MRKYKNKWFLILIVFALLGSCGSETESSEKEADISVDTVPESENLNQEATETTSQTSTTALASTTTTLLTSTTTASTTTTSTTTEALINEEAVLLASYQWGPSEETKILQTVLNLEVDGWYGEATRAAHLQELETRSLNLDNVPSAPTTTTTQSPYSIGLQDPSVCYLSSPGGAIHLGYSRPADRLPSTGSVEAVVLFADFQDVAANQTTEEVFSIISPGGESFFNDQSYGRLQLSFRPHHEWLRLSGPSTTYKEAIKTFTGHRDFLQEAMDLADASVDFTGADAVLVVSTPNATEVGYGPAFMGGSWGPDAYLSADGMAITNGVTSGADLTYWGDLWYPHEMGHSLGLPDLYGASIPGRDGFTRPFSLMDDIGSAAPGYMGYSRWILRWLSDSQVACVADDTDVVLTPIENAGGLKIAVVPVSTSKALVVESRRAIGYDSSLNQEGAVAYYVNIDKSTQNHWNGGLGQGPMEVLNNAQALLVGGTVTYENITVTVLESGADGDLVRIEVAD